MMQERLAQIAHEIETQDNRITAEPVFVVQNKKKLFGVDSDYHNDGFEWYSVGSGDWSVTEGQMFDWLQSNCNDYENKIDAPEDAPEGFDEDEWDWGSGPWRRVYYKVQWEFATSCFTEHGCNEYLRINGHNLTEPRIYVYSGYRNQEWIDLRKYLLSHGSASVVVEGGEE